MIRDYKDLQVWQKGIELVNEIYVLTKRFPKDEVFGLVNQMRQAAVSILTNIAEGWMGQHTNEYIQFIYHALGSCGEPDTQIIISKSLGYLEEKIAADLSEKINHITRMSHNLVKGLRK